MPVEIAATPQPILGPDGTVTAYLVPAAELDRLRAEVVAAREREEDYWQKLLALLPKATAEEEEEMKHLMETAIPDGLDHLIAELEAEGYPDGRR